MKYSTVLLFMGLILIIGFSGIMFLLYEQNKLKEEELYKQSQTFQEAQSTQDNKEAPDALKKADNNSKLTECIAGINENTRKALNDPKTEGFDKETLSAYNQDILKSQDSYIEQCKAMFPL